MKKYEFTEETKVVFGITFHRIRAVVSFGIVKKGELGGWIEKEGNLDHSGNAWVYGNAWVSGNAQVLWISGIGSRAGTTTFFFCKDKKIRVTCGCFFGDLEQFSAKVQETHGDNRYGGVYRLAIEMAKKHIVAIEAVEEAEELEVTSK